MKLLKIGSTLMIGGLLVVAVDTVFPSHNEAVAIGWLLCIPLLVSASGAALVCVGLARGNRGLTHPAVLRRVVGMSAVAGLGLALGYGAAGIVSQIPDDIAGLNGTYVAGPGPGVAAFLLAGLGVAAGLLAGGAVTAVWWSVRRSQHASAGR